MSAERLWRVIGPPGTGQRKTTFLSAQARRAVQAHGPSSVAIISLTRAAANEIAARDTHIEGDGNVGTLHAACYHALDRPGLAETPDGLRAWNAEHPDLALSGGRVSVDDAPAVEGSGRTRGDELHAIVQAHRARMTPQAEWTEEQRDHHARWTDYKRQTETLDFTDLIERGLADLPTHPANPRVLLGDEAQDLSALELALFRQWAGACDTAVMSSDTDQALFLWRGASPDALMDMPVAGTRVLRQSHRVPRAVHAVATRWVAQLTRREAADYRPTGLEGAVRRSPVSLRWPDPLLHDLQADLQEGASVMVLTTCGYMLAPLLRVLRDRGVPFANPHRPTHGAWNPLRAGGRVLSFLRPSEEAWGEKARCWTWADLRAWTEPLAAHGTLVRGAKAFIDERCTPDRFGESRAAEEVSLENLAWLLDTPSLEHPALRLDVDWWESRLKASAKGAQNYPLAVLRARGPRALREKPRLTVGTGHSVKGGEADRVYLSPDISPEAAWRGWHAGGVGRDSVVRLGYVMSTRAREALTLLEPSGPEHMPIETEENAMIGMAA